MKRKDANVSPCRTPRLNVKVICNAIRRCDMSNGMIVCVSNCSHQLLRNSIGTKDGKHGIKRFLEVDKYQCSCQVVVVYFFNNPSQGNGLRDR